jgi:hypothetical protein
LTFPLLEGFIVGSDLIGAMFILVWKLPVSLAVLALMLLDGVALAVGWRFGSAQIRKLLLA